MKNNTLFEQCLANVSPEVKIEVDLNIDIANRIDDLLKTKGMTQRDLAKLMNKRESEISRWLSGDHGYTTKTLAKITAVLKERIISVEGKKKDITVYSLNSYASFPKNENNTPYITKKNNRCSFKYTLN